MEWVKLTLGHLPTSRKFPCNEVHCETPHKYQPYAISLLDISLPLRNLAKGLVERNRILYI